MRYFCNPDITVAIKDIASEAFNLEAGKICFQKNALLEQNTNANAKIYPSFVIDGVCTTIKSNSGFIFVPEYLLDSFVVHFKNMICDLTKLYEQVTGKDHLQGYSTLETNVDHFTILKAKHSLDSTISSKFANESVKRRIYVNDSNDKLDKIIGLARFTWVIYTIEQFMIDLTKFYSRNIPIECQLVSIIYDPKKLINLKNGELLINNLTFRNFNICKNLLSVCSYGEINSEFLARYSKNNNEILSGYVDSIKKNIIRPEYIPGWEPGELSIHLCEKRRGAFEIIKHLGNKLIYTDTYLPIFPITQTIYEVNYQDIIIDNSSEQKDNNICAHCDTPLYNDIYVVFSDSNIGKAYCCICLHSKFDVNSRRADISGMPLYNSDNIIARVKYPRTHTQVIEYIESDILVKNIISQSFDPLYIENDNSIVKALYLNFQLSNTKYIGWNSSISSFISYITNSNNNIHSKFSSKQDFLEYIKNCYIFYYINITY